MIGTAGSGGSSIADRDTQDLRRLTVLPFHSDARLLAILEFYVAAGAPALGLSNDRIRHHGAG